MDRKLLASRLGVALVGANAPLFHAIRGGSFAVDDWGFLDASDGPSSWLIFTDYLNRPGQWLIHVIQFTLLGENRAAHSLVLAVGGALVAVLLFECVRSEFDDVVGLSTGLLWGVLPMVTSIRYWASTTPTLIAMALLLWALTGIAGKTSPSNVDLLKVSVAVAVSTLIYEAGVPIGLSLIFLSWWFRTGRVWSFGALLGLIPIVALGYNFVTRTEAAETRRLFEFASVAPKALFGHGLLPDGAGAIGGLVIGVPVVVLLTSLMPSFRQSWHREAVLGILVAAAGSSIFVVVGFPFVTRGVMDRSAACASLGVALFLGSLVAAVLRSNPMVGVPVLALGVLGLGATNLSVSGQVQQAERDVYDAFEQLGDLPPDAMVTVYLPSRSGWVSGLGADAHSMAARQGAIVPAETRFEVEPNTSADAQIRLAFIGE